jgi:hypothetical protein
MKWCEINDNKCEYKCRRAENEECMDGVVKVVIFIV